MKTFVTTFRTQIKRSIAVVLCAVIPSVAFAGDTGFKVNYDGGSIPGVKAGNSLRLFVDSNQIRLAKDKSDVLIIAAPSITELSYGQDVHRRVGAAIGLAVVSLGIGALMALTKSKKHFIGVTWDDSGKKGGLAIQVDENEYRGVLAGLEGVTGKKAVNSDAMTVKN